MEIHIKKMIYFKLCSDTNWWILIGSRELTPLIFSSKMSIYFVYKFYFTQQQKNLNIFYEVHIHFVFRFS